MPAALFSSAFQKFDEWRPALLEQLPDLDLRQWPDVGDPADIDVLLVWAPPEGALVYPNLKLVQCLGAGVDHLVSLPIPAQVQLARLIDQGQVEGFVHFVLAAVLGAHRDLHRYRISQSHAAWQPRRRVQAKDRVVGVMGLGEMGGSAAAAVARLGFQVRGWSRGEKQVDGVEVLHGAPALGRFLNGVDILICALPLTAETRGILNAAVFDQLAPGAYVINVGRGGHCNEPDLIEAVNSGRLSGAFLDVAAVEPLDPGSPLWRTPGIDVTPHMATTQVAASAAAAAARNILRVRAGQVPVGLVDRQRNY